MVKPRVPLTYMKEKKCMNKLIVRLSHAMSPCY